MLDGVVISDIHLGNRDCRTVPIYKLLMQILKRRIKTKRLFFLGDIIDSPDFSSWTDQHFKILDAIKRLVADNLDGIGLDRRVEFVRGNHDGNLLDLLFPGNPSELVSICSSGDKRFLLAHGHNYDPWFDRPNVVAFSEWGYGLLRRLDPTQTLSRLAKYASERWIDDRQKIERVAVQEAWKWSVDGVVCGHTHEAECREHSTGGQKIAYANCGSFTQSPCTFVTISAGRLRVEEIR